jgi:PKD domain.
LGGCVVPFALLEIWADPNGHGTHSDYRFDAVRLEDWYLLLQLRQPAQRIEDIRFRDVAALESGSSVASVLKGSVRGVSFDNVTLANKVVKKDADLPLEVSDGVSAPTYSGDDGDGLIYSSGLIVRGRKVRFQAHARPGAVRYEWSFGDGTHAAGRVVQHAFADDEGTLWDHSGRFGCCCGRGC